MSVENQEEYHIPQVKNEIEVDPESATADVETTTVEPNGVEVTPEAAPLSDNDRLGQVTARLAQLRHQQTSLASTMPEMQGTHGGQYTRDIEHVGMQISALEQEQKKLLKKVDRSPRSLRSLLGRLAGRH